jgi:tetratricopeptide (TPR) repeat protein
MDRVWERATFAAMSGDSDAMNSALIEARASDVSGGRITMLEGLHELASGNAAEALRHLRAATNAMPDSVAALALMATASLYENKYHDFLALVAKLARLEAKSTEDYLFKGQALSLNQPDDGLPLLDRAVAARSSPLAHMLRAEARVFRAMGSGRAGDIEDALADVATARARSWSQRNVTLLITSCHAHVIAARIHRRAGDAVRCSDHLEQAELDGLELERFSRNPQAARWRVFQLEQAGREDDALRYMERLNREGKGRNAPIQASYGVALLIRGEPEKALSAFTSVPPSDWIDWVRPLALLELPGRRDQFEEELRNLGTAAPTFLLYSGRSQLARESARDLLADPNGPLQRLPVSERRGVEYLAGRLTEAEFLNAARGSLVDLGLAHTLIGFQRCADGDRTGAIEHFGRMLETGTFLGPVYDWARVATAQLSRHPVWPPPPEPQE